MAEKPDGVTIVCDSCHESMIHHMESASAEVLKSTVTKKAVDAGWEIKDGLARCPDCLGKVLN